MESITSKIVSCLKDIDKEQKAGGIYALPERLSKGKRPASHHLIFGGEHSELDLCARIGSETLGTCNKRIQFKTEEEVASIQFIDIALTKVRAYGDSFQLDKHHGKKWEDCSRDLKKAVTKLVKEAKTGFVSDTFLVAFVFADSEKHSKDLITPSIEEDFLSRYGLTSSHESWIDSHGRGIWTTVLCWRARNCRA